MKFIRALIVLIILAGPLMAEESGDVVILGDFDNTFQGFGFSRGELITVDPESESLTGDIDFILDLPNGLGMNNSILADWFSGEAVILDLGDVPLEETSDLPAGDFTPFLMPEEIIEGNTYLVQWAEAGHYGMFRILDFDSENSLLSFNWIYVSK